ncbi:MAG TPA: mercuric transporter MerT family protein [Elusimicrobiota bacterium]|nr:mercuric transporter MerT family protein [Elusimicrobiota bacterium]
MKNKLISIAAVVSAALASVCCIGPLVLAALGLGSLGAAAGLTRYRPLFLVLTTIVLAIGFYLAYRKRPVACADGTCEHRSGSRTMKAGLWAVTVAAAALATFPNWAAVALRRSQPVAAANAQTIELSVSGMDCAACAVGIKNSLEKVPGVKDASIDFAKGEATVVAGNGRVDPSALVRAVEASGPYKAQIKKIN